MKTMEATMKLHGSPKSPYVRKMLICAQELGVLPRLQPVRSVRSVAAMLKPDPSIMVDLNALADGPLLPQDSEARWQALRWHALGDGLLGMSILWRNEREREHPLPALLDAFESKPRATIALLENDAGALGAPLSIGAITIGCAPGYADYRFDTLDWRAFAPALSVWLEQLRARPFFQSTETVDG